MAEEVRIVQESNRVNEFTKNIKTDPVESGSSINIKTSSKTEIKLPKNTKFWPTLSGKVINHVLSGLFEPVIGYFSIDLKGSERRTEELKARFLSKEKTIKYQ